MANHLFTHKRPATADALPGEAAPSCAPHRNRAGARFPGNERGFTMVEMMVSIMLMIFGLFAVLQVQIVALNKTTIAYQLTTASALAEQSLEDIMSWSAGDPRLSGAGVQTTGLTLGNSPTISNVRYTITYTLTQNTPISGMTEVDVSVTTGTGGRNITIKGYREVI
jgi:Tfp pilus assembly protein PilV